MGDWTDLTIALPTLINVLFAFAFGACAGSFIHVVTFRMPAGLSVISPPSRCPTCGHLLPWHQNLPIIGYLSLRGHCSACGVRIPLRYLLSEVAMGLLFVGIYAVLFLPGPTGFWYPVGEGWWRAQGAMAALPALVVVLWATGALVAMTLCDARTFLIPVAIPTGASIVAFIGWPLAAAVAHETGTPFPMAAPPWPVGVAAVGALAGLGIARILLSAGMLPRSFSDWDDYAEGEGDVFADYPFARREMIKEVAFVGPAVLLAGCGWFIANSMGAPEAMHPAVGALFAVATGFVVGGGIIWGLRIVATVLLDTEALGLGDVHLMSAVGAAFGWRVALVGFIAAPFLGLGWWAANLFRKAPMRMPFGPSLAAGSFAAWALKPVLAAGVAVGLGWMGTLGTNARAEPGGALALAVVLALAAAVAARLARPAGGTPTAAAILLMVSSVVAWILAAPHRLGAGAAVGGVLVVIASVASLVCGAGLEEEPGPRTALSRILRLLAFVVVFVGLFLVIARPVQTIQ